MEQAVVAWHHLPIFGPPSTLALCCPVTDSRTRDLIIPHRACILGGKSALSATGLKLGHIFFRVWLGTRAWSGHVL
jgi:hypothetical protein